MSNLNRFRENLNRRVVVVKVFLRSLLGFRTTENYFKGLEEVAGSEEARNERLAERVELKKKEFLLKQRIQSARTRGKKLVEDYREYDPKAGSRRMVKFYALLTLGMISFFLLLRACTGC